MALRGPSSVASVRNLSWPPAVSDVGTHLVRPEFVHTAKAMAGYRPMRIHTQNPADDPLFVFSRAMWDEAVGRAPAVGTGHEVTIGDTDADFATGVADAEALVTEIGVVASKFPCQAPGLKLLFVTNAGLDRLAPF